MSRKQINMAPDTLMKVGELLAHLETCGARDIRSSELFHALVCAAYEAKAHVDLSDVRPRGRWGSPRAAAFREELTKSLKRAISRSFAQP